MTDEAFVQAISDFKTANLTVSGASTDVCSIYRGVRPILAGVLPFLKLIPVYGATISEALTALMSVLDNLCPAPAATTAPAKA